MNFIKRIFGAKKADAATSAAAHEPLYRAELGEQLEKAVLTKNAAELTRLLAERADPNTRVGIQEVPLITAISVREGDSEEVAEIVRILIESGADADATWTDNIEKQTTALMIAAESDYGILTKTLLECGADPNLRDGTGRTALERCQGQEPYKLLNAATVAKEFTLFEAIAHAKALEDPDADRISIQYGEPIVVEKSCASCGFYDRTDHSCGEHDAGLGGQRIHFTPEVASNMYCSRWEDEALIGLLIRGFTAPGISYHRRHPQLIESESKQAAWASFSKERLDRRG